MLYPQHHPRSNIGPFQKPESHAPLKLGGEKKMSSWEKKEKCFNMGQRKGKGIFYPWRPRGEESEWISLRGQKVRKHEGTLRTFRAPNEVGMYHSPAIIIY